MYVPVNRPYMHANAVICDAVREGSHSASTNMLAIRLEGTRTGRLHPSVSRCRWLVLMR